LQMTKLGHIVAVLVSLFLSACIGCMPAVSDEEAAQRAVQGLERAMSRAIQLGFDGFNAASSANIPEQIGDGADAGTMTIAGQVDQGASANKGMRLTMALTEYTDGEVEETIIAYDTEAPVDVELSLRDIPDGTLTGTVLGTVVMSGDLSGPIALDFAITGSIEAATNDEVQLVDGSTEVTGNATSDYGTFAIDFTF